MADNDLRSFRSALECIKTELACLKESIVSINQRIETLQIVPEETIQTLSDILVRYREQYAALRDAGDRISISIGTDINEIENALQLYQERQVFRQLREVILDYFRLSAESARVRTSLEESKRQLMEKCLQPVAELAEDIHAYKIVVENAREPRAALPDREYQMLENTFGLRIADASDNHLLRIDEAADLSDYLNGSCSLLMPVDDDSHHHPKIGTETKAENDLASDGESQSSSHAEDTMDVSVPLWPDFGSYIDGLTFRMMDSSAEDEVTLEEIRALIEAHYELPYLLSMLANEKLLSVEKVNALKTSGVSLSQSMECLIEKGFVTAVEVSVKDKPKHYLVLTEKGWTCFRNAKLHEAISNKEMYFSVPNLVQACKWTNASLYRTAAICEFMNAIDAQGAVIHEENFSFVYAYVDKVNGAGALVSAALLEKGSEAPYLARMKAFALSCKKAEVHRLVILVADANDIAKVNDALMLPDEVQTLVQYGVIGDETKLCDSTGQPIFHQSENKRDLGEKDTSSIQLKPRFAIQATNKLPSKQDFSKLLNQYSPVLPFAFNIFPIALMFTEQQMTTVIANGRDEINIASLRELESKGYIGSYEYEGVVYYVASKLMAECAKKDQLKRVYKAKYQKLSPLRNPNLVIAEETPVQIFKKYVERSNVFWNFQLKILPDAALKRLCRSITWDNHSERHYLNLHKQGISIKKLLMVGEEEFVTAAPNDENGVICSANELPALQATVPDAYYCLTDTLYVWNGEKWLSIIDDVDADQNISQ